MLVRFPTLPSQLLIFIFFFNPISPFTLRTLPNNSSFDPDIALAGDAELVAGDDDSHVELTRPGGPSFGLLILTKPLRLDRSTSFNTEFTFLVSPDNADGLVLSLFPGGDFLPREKGLHNVQFVTAAGGNVTVSDLSGSYVKTEAGVLVPNSGEKLKSWVDYDPNSKNLEVRLSKFGESRPYSPLFAYSIDLPEKCGGKEVFVGLSASHGNSSRLSSVFSWRVRLKNVPKWMHSIPVDPRRYSDEKEEHLQENHLRPLTVFAGLIFATGCGALMAFVVLFMWAIVANRHTVFPAAAPSVDFQYEKVSVVVEGSKDGGIRE